MRKIAIVPAATKVLEYFNAKFAGKIPAARWDEASNSILIDKSPWDFERLLLADKWTELHSDDLDRVGNSFKRQTMQITVSSRPETTQTRSGKSQKVTYTTVTVADKVSIPPVQVAAAKYKKLIFGGLKDTQVGIWDGAIDISWSQRGGHAGTNTVRAIIKRAVDAGFKKKNATNRNTPDGSMISNGVYYLGPKGETLQVSEGYGAVSWDNQYSATLKVPATAAQ